MTKAMPPPFAPDPPAERGKQRTEYPGGASSAILASSPAGRSQVSVSSMMSMLLSWMKVDMSDLLEVPTDLALKRQTRSVFSAEEELRGMWSSCLWGGRSGALSEEAERSSWSLGGEEGGMEVVCWHGAGELEELDESWSRKLMITLIFLRSFFPPLLDRRGFLGTFLAMPRCDRRAISWGEVRQRFPETEGHVECSGGQGRHRWQTTLSSLCCVAHGCCDARLQWTRCHWTQAQHDRLAASSVKQRVEPGLVETEQDQLSSLPVEVTHKTGTTITATSRGTMLSRQLIKPGDKSSEICNN